MLGNVLWYGGDYEPTKSVFKLLFIDISIEEIIIALMINFMNFPVIFLIVSLFKYSIPRKLKENRIFKALVDNCEEDDDSNNNIEDDENLTESATEPEDKQTPANGDKKRKFSLPFYCAYIGWTLSIFCIAVSVFLVWAYGITFGNEVIYKWLTAFFISFIISFLVFEPIKVG